jgi:DeoR/GlpR family transcriptional regulator of sugar metabolism
LNTKRRDVIKDLLNAKGEVFLKDLETMFPDCSSMTLRRDLKFFEEDGLVKRTRGGAVALSRLSMAAEDIYSRRALENTAAKMQIAIKAATFVESGRSLFLDSGTTLMMFAKQIPDDFVSLLTSGPNIALELIKKTKPTVMLIGGQLSRNTISVSGANASAFLSSVNIDTAFMAASGFSLQNGFTSGTYSECELKQDVLRRASKVIMLMDSTKVGKSLPYTFGTLSDIDVLISDGGLTQDILIAAKQAGVEVV